MPVFDFFKRDSTFSRKRTNSRLTAKSGNGSTANSPRRSDTGSSVNAPRRSDTGNSGLNVHGQSIVTPPSIPGTPISLRSTSPVSQDVYHNARLDPKNYLEGPLSWNASTRLRQMLARPGIVVSYPSL